MAMATPAATITMTMREADRLKTIQAVVDRVLRVGQAAQRLGTSRRQIERLVSRHRDDGPCGLVSRKRGRPINNQLAPGLPSAPPSGIHALQAALVIEAQRDDRRRSNTPSRTNQGQMPYPKKALPGAKRSRHFISKELDRAVMSACKDSRSNHLVAQK